MTFNDKIVYSCEPNAQPRARGCALRAQCFRLANLPHAIFPRNSVSKSTSNLATPASLNAAKSKDAASGADSFSHPALQRTAALDASPGFIVRTEGLAFSIPFVRYLGSVLDGMTLTANFGLFELKIVRTQQPPDEADPDDRKGTALLDALLVAFTEQNLTRLSALPDQLEIRVETKDAD